MDQVCTIQYERRIKASITESLFAFCTHEQYLQQVNSVRRLHNKLPYSFTAHCLVWARRCDISQAAWLWITFPASECWIIVRAFIDCADTKVEKIMETAHQKSQLIKTKQISPINISFSLHYQTWWFILQSEHKPRSWEKTSIYNMNVNHQRNLDWKRPATHNIAQRRSPTIQPTLEENL